MLANVWPEVLEYLLKRSNLNQNQFADRSGISQKMVSRYATGKNPVGASNFKNFARGFGLTLGQLGYVYAWFLMKQYRAFRFDLGTERGSEIREPAATYDAPSARERAETLLRFDLNQVPVDLAPPLRLIREELRETLKEQEKMTGNLEERLLRLVELHEQLLESAVHVWKEIKSLRGE